MYKHANDEIPLKVSCKKYLEKVSWGYYLYLVSSRYFSKVSSSCIFKILFCQYLHLVSSRYFL